MYHIYDDLRVYRERKRERERKKERKERVPGQVAVLAYTFLWATVSKGTIYLYGHLALVTGTCKEIYPCKIAV